MLTRLLSPTLLLLLACCPHFSHAQALLGSWKGALEIQGISLPLVLHVQEEQGKLTGSLDSPMQGATGIPLTFIQLKNDTLDWKAGSIAASFSGRLESDSVVMGTFSQGGLKLPLRMTPYKEAAESLRPQTPQPPFPYTDVEISFTSGAANLAGTLSIPEGEGPFPAIILVAGSGPLNRNQEIMGHQTFTVLADFLVRKGWAVFRYDKRGIGASTGDYAKATTDSLAQDAAQARIAIRSHKSIDSLRIGYLGHSEGSLISAMVAAQGSMPSFIISLGGPGVRGDSLLLEQTEALSKAGGVGIDERLANRSLNAAFYRTAASDKNDRQARWEMELYLSEWLMNFDDTLRVELEKQIKEQFPVLLSPWFRRFVQLSPSQFWRKVTCPVLILQGELDLQVIESNGTSLRDILRATGNREVSLNILPEHNHAFQRAKTGLPAEYGVIRETISMQALNQISNWLKRFQTP